MFFKRCRAQPSTFQLHGAMHGAKVSQSVEFVTFFRALLSIATTSEPQNPRVERRTYFLMYIEREIERERERERDRERHRERERHACTTYVDECVCSYTHLSPYMNIYTGIYVYMMFLMFLATAQLSMIQTQTYTTK